MVCYDQWGTKSVLNCSGRGEPRRDYCAYRPDDYLFYLGDNRAGAEGRSGSPYPLFGCEGDCDVNDDCIGKLKCYLRSGHEEVPGCRGKGGKNVDYCYDEVDAAAIAGEGTADGTNASGCGDPELTIVDNLADGAKLENCRGDCSEDGDCKVSWRVTGRFGRRAAGGDE